jgi:hypothetical protein
MKKMLVLVTTVLLAFPAVSFAGSATSKWDMTLGGYVKFDLTYATKAVGTDNRLSPVDSKGGVDRAQDSAKNLTWSGAETRLNWLIKGPDAWGAKTSAMVEGDFRAASSTRGTTNQGEFGLRHAFMKFDWPTTTLLVGHTWQTWVSVPAPTILAVSEEHFNRGATRVPQIRLTQKFGGFAVAAAVQSPYDVNTTNNVGNDPRANSLIPDLALDFSYGSNSLGKIGPFGFKVGAGGFWGKDKYEYRPAGASGARIDDKTLDRYGAGLYWFVPVIPEKKEGDKAMAFAFTGQVFSGKGMATYLPCYTNTSGVSGYSTFAGFPGAYNRAQGHRLITTNPTNGAFDPAYYMTNGGWLQATFYFTDKLFMNAVYGAEFNRVSNGFKAKYTYDYTNLTTASPAGVLAAATDSVYSTASGSAVPERIQNIVVNMMYDVNPAVRLGIEYDWVKTAYAYHGDATHSNKGSFHSVRAGAYYFF